MVSYSWFRTFVIFAIFLSAHSAEWDDLRVHFGMNLLSSQYFVQMPRTETEAIAQGMRLDGNGCSDNSGFLGRRYVRADGDRSIMLLYDIQGTIAGIQTGIPKSTVGFPTDANKRYHNVYLEGVNEHMLTAYFVDAAIICNTGRNSVTLESQGTGDRLGFQVGRSNSSNAEVIDIPLTETQLQATTKWSKGHCFVFMGQHYWYNIRKDMDCMDLFPGFLLYNGGKLDGFGFAMGANLNGKFYEHPTVSTANYFFPLIPSCMNEPNFPQSLTTVHIYMYNKPWKNICVW